MRLLIRWGINTVLILALSYLLPDKVLAVGSITAALAAALVLGLLNTFARPVFVLLSLPLSVGRWACSSSCSTAWCCELLAWLIGESYALGGFVLDARARRRRSRC